MDIFANLGELAIGSRLRRLSDQIMEGGAAVYALYGVDFNPSWFPVFYVISSRERSGIMEIAGELGITHPAVIKVVKELEKHGLVQSTRGEQDRRKRWLVLTARGQELLPSLQLAWKDMAAALSLAMQESPNNLQLAVWETEQAFARKSLENRVKELRSKRMSDKIRIVEYSPALQKHFKQINEQWMEASSWEEMPALEDPKSEILDRGGCILFAMYDNEVAGACALRPKEEDVYELTRMGVYEKFRGRQVGKRLCKAIIQRARELGARRIVLELDKQMSPAIGLYTGFGFTEVSMPGESSRLEESSIRMELSLPKRN